MIGVILVIVSLLLIGIWVYIEVQKFKHKAIAIFLIGLLVFIYITGAFVLKDKGASFKSVSGMMTATKIYFSWLGTVFVNLKTITSNAMKLNWENQNKTR